jgi:glucokinase
MVSDIGGTHLRTGIFSEKEGLLVNDKTSSQSFHLHPNTPIYELQEHLVNDLLKEFFKYEQFGHTLDGISVAFPGPINSKGEVLNAATLWGGYHGQYPLKQRLLSALPNKKIEIINDITAAAWRYIDEVEGNFGVITVSSGIGNKIMVNKNVLIDNDGVGGEIGHYYVGGKYKDLLCDCGEYGHLGAISSGRGVISLANYLKKYEKRKFEASTLLRKETITTYDIVESVKHQDPYGLFVLRESIKPLAKAISFLYYSIGVAQYKIIGGFAHAIGRDYIVIINEEIQNIVSPTLFNGLFKIKTSLGHGDDANGLIGAGKYIINQRRSV